MSDFHIEDDQPGKPAIRRGEYAFRDRHMVWMDQIGIARFRTIERHDETIPKTAIQTFLRNIRPVFDVVYSRHRVLERGDGVVQRLLFGWLQGRFEPDENAMQDHEASHRY